MSTDTIPKASAEATELDKAFEQAMQGPSLPREPGPPPEVDPQAPFGRDEAGAPIAKYGYKNDGSIRLTGAGRRSKDDMARVAPAQDVPEPGKGKGPVKAGPENHGVSFYENKLTEFGTQLWLLVGFVSPADAGAIDHTLQPMAAAWAKGAEEDPTVRRAVNYISSELWISGVIASTLPFLAIVAANHGRLPEKMMTREKQAEQKAVLIEECEAKRALVFSQMAEAQGAE